MCCDGCRGKVVVGKAAIRLPSKESVLKKKIVVIVVTGRANSTAAEAVIIIKTLESDMKNTTMYYLHIVLIRPGL